MAETALSPTFIDGEPLFLAGTCGTYTMKTRGEIPAQWVRFRRERLQHGQSLGPTYGVIFGGRGQPMQYWSATEVSAGELPAGWQTVAVPAQHYAVFKAHGGIEKMRATWMGIWGECLEGSGCKPTDGPMVEWYAADYAGPEGGDFEVRIPVERT
jgi:predicted transcriptional regulator YdeE